ncbi:MAG: rhomboid family intramembrane serine protease [Gemmatimonadota bacterium]|nr:rhomboid family intramembrane serine protease [Gemmatimonadota bacterium]
MTSWVKRLLIANVAVYLLQQAYPDLSNILAFAAARVLTAPWTPITYMFVHGSIWHIFFNMLVLYFFGPRVEARLGGTRFLSLYFIAGLAGAALSSYNPYVPIIGASGAIFGVELAYARYWPRDKILIYGVIPIEARWLIVIMTLMSIFGIGGAGIAHLAHLGGFIGAAIYLFIIEHTRSRAVKASGVRPQVKQPAPPRGDDMKRWSTIPRGELHEINRSEVDRLLDKISLKGIDSLTPAERAALDRFSKQKS